MRHVQSELGDDDPDDDEDRPFAEEEYDEEEVSEQDEEGEDEEDTLVNAKDLFDEVSTDLPTISSILICFFQSVVIKRRPTPAPSKPTRLCHIVFCLQYAVIQCLEAFKRRSTSSHLSVSSTKSNQGNHDGPPTTDDDDYGNIYGDDVDNNEHADAEGAADSEDFEDYLAAEREHRSHRPVSEVCNQK